MPLSVPRSSWAASLYSLSLPDRMTHLRRGLAPRPLRVVSSASSVRGRLSARSRPRAHSRTMCWNASSAVPHAQVLVYPGTPRHVRYWLRPMWPFRAWTRTLLSALVRPACRFLTCLPFHAGSRLAVVEWCLATVACQRLCHSWRIVADVQSENIVC